MDASVHSTGKVCSWSSIVSTLPPFRNNLAFEPAFARSRFSSISFPLTFPSPEWWWRPEVMWSHC